MGQKGLPTFMSHEPMFQISSQSNEEIQIYWPTKVGIKFGALMVMRENNLELILMF